MVRRSEAVQVLEKRLGYFPKRFRWHGRHFTVLRVERVWCTARVWPSPVERRHFSVWTAEGAFVLYHDLSHDVWAVGQAPRLPRSRPRAFELRLESW